MDCEAAGEQAHRAKTDIDGELAERGMSKGADMWPPVRISGVAFVTVRLPTDS